MKQKKEGNRKQIIIALLIAIFIHFIIIIIFLLKREFLDQQDQQQLDAQNINLGYQESVATDQEPATVYYDLSKTEVEQATSVSEAPSEAQPSTSQTEITQEIQETQEIEVTQERIEEVVEVETKTETQLPVEQERTITQISTEKVITQTIRRRRRRKRTAIKAINIFNGFAAYRQAQMEAENAAVSYATQADANAMTTQNINNEMRAALSHKALCREIAMSSHRITRSIVNDRFIDKIIPIEITFTEGGKIINVELFQSCGNQEIDQLFKQMVFDASPITRYAKQYKGQPFKIRMDVRFEMSAGVVKPIFQYS